MAVYIFLFLVTGMGFLIQTIAGFGSAVFAIPLCMLVVDKAAVLPAFYILSVLQSVTIVYKDHRLLLKKEFLRMLLLAVLGIPIGMASGKIIESDLMSLGVGGFVIINSIRGMIRLTKLATEDVKQGGKRFHFLLPMCSGFLQAAYGMGGPLIATYMETITKDKKKYRVMLCLYWCLLNPIIIGSMMLNGQIDRAQIGYLLLLIPAMGVGVVVGNKVSDRISGKTFQKFVYLVLIFVGITMIF